MPTFRLPGSWDGIINAMCAELNLPQTGGDKEYGLKILKLFNDAKGTNIRYHSGDDFIFDEPKEAVILEDLKNTYGL
jgi:hypothetical protein